MSSNSDATEPSSWATAASRPGISVYTGASLGGVYEVMSAPEYSDGAFDESVDGRDLLAGGAVVDVVFCDDRPDGFSLVNLRLAPDYPLAAHHHDVDCLYYVQSGAILLGRRRIEAGGGFRVSAKRPYAYRAGPEGATVLEFRQATAFNIVITEASPAKWREMVDVARQHDGWPGYAESVALPKNNDA